MSGAAPLWLTALLGVLAVVGTIGGAWGGQFIAGRNDKKRWEQERDREARAYWRERRLAAYSAVLGSLDKAVWEVDHSIGVDAEEVFRDVHTHLNDVHKALSKIRIIGSDEAINETSAAIDSLKKIITTFRHPSRSGPNRVTVLRNDLTGVLVKIADLEQQYREDLDVSPPGKNGKRGWFR